MNKRITKKQIKNFIEKVADTKEWDHGLGGEPSLCYYSKVDGSYITHVGLEDRFKFYLRFGITEQIQSIPPNGRTACIGYNPKEQKWYGWSHRAVYGFGVGSTCNKGDCHYIPDTKEHFIDSEVTFWHDDEYHDYTVAEEGEKDGVSGVFISWTYSNKTPNEKLRGEQGGVFISFPDNYGKGEWVAKNLADAKQMAIDFAQGVS